jgi:O-antigen/teichoic acid export membrane protein
MSEEKQFFWNYLSLGIGQTGAYVSQLLLTIIIARAIQPEGYGILSLFLMIGGIFCLLLIDWPNSSIIRYGKQEFIETEKISELFWARSSILLVTFLIALFTLLFFKNFMDDYVGIKNASFLLIGYICSTSMILFISTIFQTTGKIKLFGFMNFISKFSLLVLVTFIIIIFHSLTIIDTILLYTLSQIFVVIVGIAIINKKWIIPINFSKEMILTIVIFTWPMIFGALSTILFNYCSTILIKTYLTISDVGIYSVAYMVITILSAIILSLPYLLLPIVATLKAQQRTQILVDFINEIIPQGVFLWSIFVSIFAIMCSFMIPIIFGLSFAQATTPMLILLIGVSFMSISAFLTCILVNYDLMKKLVFLSILIAILNLVGSLILIPMIGLNGAALATACSYAIVNILYIPFIYPNLLISFGNNVIETSNKWIVKYNFPIFLVLPICLFINNLIIRIILSVILIIFSLIIARRMNLFRLNTIKYLEYVEMPNPIKNGVKKIYQHLILNNSS